MGGQFFIMDYGLVCQPITSLAIYVRTSELYHCTLYLDKEASPPGTVQAGCSVFNSTSSTKAVEPLVAQATELAPLRRQVAHAVGNLLARHKEALGKSQAWANSLAADTIEGQLLELPAAYLGMANAKGPKHVVGTVGQLVPLHVDKVPAGAFDTGAGCYKTLGAYKEAMRAQQVAAMHGKGKEAADPAHVSRYSLPAQLGDVLVEFRVPSEGSHRHIPFSQLMRLHAQGEAQLLGKGSTVQDVYQAANNPLALL